MNITEDEINLIKTKITRNSAINEATMKKKFNPEFYEKMKNQDILELKSGKVKFKTSFWNENIKLKKTKKKKAKKPSQKLPIVAESNVEIEKIVQSIVDQKFESIFGMISKLDNRIKIIEQNSSITSQINKSTISSNDFKIKLKKSYDLINFNERSGGMVPIPKIWDELKEQGISRNQFEKELFDLELERIIELQIASDPRLVKESEKSIKHPSRGLINYVVWRR